MTEEKEPFVRVQKIIANNGSTIRYVIQIGEISISVPKWLLLVLIVLSTISVVGPVVNECIVRNQPLEGGILRVAIVEFKERKDTKNTIIPSSVGNSLSKTIEAWLKQKNSDQSANSKIIKSNPIEYLVGIPENKFLSAIEKIAEKFNANFVIYGLLDTASKQLSPEFYLSGDYEDTLEITGYHAFRNPIRFIQPLSGENRANLEEKLKPRVETLFDVALANIKLSLTVPSFRQEECRAPRIEESQTLLVKIIEERAGGITEEGLEVVYLFQGVAYSKLGHLFYKCSLLKETQARQKNSTRILEESQKDLKKAIRHFNLAQDAFEEALDINPQYARAYLAWGALLYGQRVQSISNQGLENPAEEKIDEAIAKYREALDATDKHPKAYVDIKANYNLGLAITAKENIQLHCSKPNEEAIEVLQNVIFAHNPEKTIDIIRQLTAKAHYQLGLLYRNCGNRAKEETIAYRLQLYDDAVEEFKNSIEFFSTKPEKDWQQDIWAIRLSLANTYLVSAELGKTDMYQQAIDIYCEITQHYEEHNNISTNIAAESYLNLGLALTQTKNTTKAAENYQQVIDLEKPDYFQERLTLKSLQNKAHDQLKKLQG